MVEQASPARVPAGSLESARDPYGSDRGARACGRRARGRCRPGVRVRSRSASTAPPHGPRPPRALRRAGDDPSARTGPGTSRPARPRTRSPAESVTGTWTVPTATCASSASGSLLDRLGGARRVHEQDSGGGRHRHELRLAIEADLLRVVRARAVHRLLDQGPHRAGRHDHRTRADRQPQARRAPGRQPDGGLDAHPNDQLQLPGCTSTARVDRRGARELSALRLRRGQPRKLRVGHDARHLRRRQREHGNAHRPGLDRDPDPARSESPRGADARPRGADLAGRARRARLAGATPGAVSPDGSSFNDQWVAVANSGVSSAPLAGSSRLVEHERSRRSAACDRVG